MPAIPRRTLLAASLAVVAAAAHGTAHAQAPTAVTGAHTLDSDGVIALIEKTPNLVIIDARHEKDFQEGHIEGAQRLLDDDMLRDGAGSLAKLVSTKSTPVLFYCNGPECGRAAKSTAAAVSWGYSDVNYYYAGIPDWRGKNLPLAK